ncbi:DnaJ homolog subfamily C member 21, partial [Durusdinium trenchii]
VLHAAGGEREPEQPTGKGTLVHEAASSGSGEMMRVALREWDMGADVDARAAVGTPLFWAAFSGSVDVASQLLDAGADVNAQDDDGLTPLLVAAARDHGDVVRRLVAAGADLHVITKHEGKTSVLHAAAAAAATEAVAAILEAEPQGLEDVLQLRVNDMTPLELAAYSQSTAVVQTLGAKLGVSEDDLVTLLADMAKRKEAEEAAADEEVSEVVAQCLVEKDNGNERFSAGDVDEALVCYSAAVALSTAMLAKLEAQRHLLHSERVEANITKVNEEALAAVLCNRSACYMKRAGAKGETSRQDLLRAKEDAQAATKAFPKWPKAFYRLGLALSALEDEADAAQAFWTGYELAPKASGAKALLTLFQRTVKVAKSKHAATEPAAARTSGPPKAFQFRLPVEIPRDSSPNAPLVELWLEFDDGEGPLEVATRFVQQHGLDPSLVPRVANHVHAHLNAARQTPNSAGPMNAWEVDLGNGHGPPHWSPCAPDLSRELDNLVASGQQQGQVMKGGWHYLLDVARGVQTNLSTGRQRAIRRQGAPSSARKSKAAQGANADLTHVWAAAEVMDVDTLNPDEHCHVCLSDFRPAAPAAPATPATVTVAPVGAGPVAQATGAVATFAAPPVAPTTGNPNSPAGLATGAPSPMKRPRLAQAQEAHVEDQDKVVRLANCHGHYFHLKCIQKWFEHKPKCPSCTTFYGEEIGTQPIGGRMTHRTSPSPLPGYPNCGTITISYSIPSGTQGPEHPNPGQPYYGTSRSAYLPDNEQGRKVLRLLQRAFDNRVVFTVGTSLTTGASDSVIWNGIHHKTSRSYGAFGYPDDKYLNRFLRLASEAMSSMRRCSALTEVSSLAFGAMAHQDASQKVLGVARDVDGDALKKAYRRAALQWHPDKNQHRVEEAEVRIKEINAAYEVLADPHERAWYDGHREAILRGGDGTAQDGEAVAPTPNLWQWFRASCFTGFDDSAQGFYAVYTAAFAEITRVEVEHGEGTASRKLPEFGCSTTTLDEVAAFYAAWEGFVTKLSFGWEDLYHPRDAENRFHRRLIEKENKKARDAARREYNESVRSLVLFVKKRDRRILALAKERAELKEQREKARLEALEEKKRRKREAREAWFAVQEQERQEQDEAARAEGKAVFRLADEHEQEEGSQASMWRCQVCSKSFKSEKQFQNHEKSKKHVENLKVMRRKLREEEKILEQLRQQEQDQASSGLDSQVVLEESNEEAEQDDGHAKDGPTGAGPGKGDCGSSAKEGSQSSDDDDDDDSSSSSSSSVDFGAFGRLERDNSDNESDASSEQEEPSQPGEQQEEEVQEEVVEEEEEEEEEQQQQQQQDNLPLPSAQISQAEKSVSAGSPESTTPAGQDKTAHFCATCRTFFASRNKLFKHIKATGHAVAPDQVQSAGKKEERASRKGKRGKKRI